MKQSLQRVTAWAKKHPWVAALIVGVVVFLAWLAYRRGAGQGEGDASNVEVSQNPASATPSGAPGEPSAGGELPIPAPSSYDVPLPNYTPSSGGGGGKGGGGKGGGGSSGGGSYDTTTTTPPPLDYGLDYGQLTGLPDLRSQAEAFYEGLAPDSDTLALINTMAAHYQPTTGMKEPGGRTGSNVMPSSKSGGAKAADTSKGTGDLRAASKNVTLPPIMSGKPNPLGTTKFIGRGGRSGGNPSSGSPDISGHSSGARAASFKVS